MKSLFASMLIFTVFMLQAANAQEDISRLIHEYRNNPEALSLPDFQNQAPVDRTNLKAAMEDFGNPPGWIWVQQFGGEGPDIGYAVTSDQIGNYYLAATFAGMIVVGNDTLYSQGSHDVLIMKLSQTGIPIWYDRIEGTPLQVIEPECIYIDDDGNVLVTGFYDAESIDFHGTILTRTGITDVFIAKYTSSGTFLWVNDYGEVERSLINSRIVTDASNNCYLFFIHQDMLIKFNEYGQLQNNYSFSGCAIDDIETNGTELFVSGRSDDNWYDFGIGIPTRHQQGLFIGKMDLTGNFIWVKTTDQVYMEFGRVFYEDMTIQSNGNLNFMWRAFNNVIWDTDTMEFDNRYVLFLSNISSDGGVNWTRYSDTSISSSFAINQILSDEQNNLYITGGVGDGSMLNFGGININPGEFLLKCDPDGIGVDVYYSEDIPSQMQIYGTDKFISTGSYEGNINIKRVNSALVEDQSIILEGRSGSGSINGMETDSNADLFVYGDVYGASEIFGIELEDGQGAFLSKHNSRGNLEWIEFMPGGGGPSANEGSCFLLNEAHDALYLVGSIYDSLEIGPEKLYMENGKSFLAKYSTAGTFGWVQQLKGIELHNSISTDMSGSVILTADSNNDSIIIGDSLFSATATKIFVAKFDIDGVFKWAFPISNTNNLWVGFTSTDKNNMIYFSGEAYPGIINFNGTEIDIQNDSEGDILFAKLDPDGNLLWFKTFGNGNGRESTWPSNIITNQDGYSYLYGFLFDTVYFDDLIVNTKSDKSSGYVLSNFVAKIDPSGNALWVNAIHMKQFEINYVEMDLDKAGNVYVMSRFRDTLVFDNQYILANAGFVDMYIARYSNNGEFDWVKSIETTDGYNRNSGIAVYDSLSLYVGGYFQNHVSFDNEILKTTSQNGFIGLLSPGQLNCDDFTVEVQKISDVTCNGGQDGIASVIDTNGLGPISYLWDNTGNSDTSYVDNLLADKYYHVTVSDAMGCVVQDSIILDEPEPIEISKSYSDLVCKGENDGYIDITLSGGTEPYVVTWSNGASTEDLSGLTPGKYYFDLTDANGCTATDTIMLDSSKVYQDSELCLLTVNNQNKVLIVWEKTYDAGIVAYRIYREQTKDNYVFIKEISFDSLSVYLDKASQPEKFAHYYKIRAVDACGNESEYSDYHKTIKLNTLPGLSGEVILQWEEYLGFDYSEYRIFRGRTLTDLHEIELISSSSKSYTDPNPPAGQIYYRVEVVKQTPCIPAMKKATEYGSTVSNYDEEVIESVRSWRDQQITIYPNPLSNSAILEFPNPENQPYSLIITDLAGKVVRTAGQITGSSIELKRDNLPPGTYIIELRGDTVYRGKLLVE